MLRKLALALALASCAGMPLCNVAEASIVDGPFAPASEMKRIAPVEEALFIHRGIAYCWCCCARKPGCKTSLDEEWISIVTALLGAE